MVEDILFRCGNVRSIEKSLSSVSLRLTALPDKASPERGGARRRRAEGFVPLRRAGRGGSVSRRDHNQAYRRPHATHRRNQLRRKVASRTPAALREWGSGGEALLSEKRPLPQNLPRISHFVHNAFSRQARHRAMCSVSHSSASASARCMLNSSAKLRLSRAAASASAVTRLALAATCSK